MHKRRGRDLGLPFTGRTGQYNAITDVPGLEVGYCTRIEGEGTLLPGSGPVRTGVTAILPRGKLSEPQPVWAGIYALNGNGEMTGSHWIRDGGYFVGPVCLTNTHSVGRVHHAATQWILNHYSSVWQPEHLWAMPVVAETYDGVLNDINGQHISEADALYAINNAASGTIAEGNVGGGTGMICYEFKGGSGSSSRCVDIDDQEFIVAAFVQANHGLRPWLTVLGQSIGKDMCDDRLMDEEQGSIIVVLATNLPMAPHQLQRLAKRAAIGIGRGGTPGGNNSGDIFLAFSTANPQSLPQLSGTWSNMKSLNDELLDPVYMAAVDSIEEAVINALLAAEDMTTLKPSGLTCKAIDADRLAAYFSSDKGT